MTINNEVEAVDPGTGTVQPAERRKQAQRARVSGFIGSTMESYDFGLYAAAAGLVFPKVFFAGLEPGLAYTLSFVILLSGYIARPLGGLLFGHIGDTLGRRNVLVVTLGLMGGASSVGIGLLPGSDSWGGAAAPILLVVLRVVQGLAYGGEYGGAVLMSLEHSSSGRRGGFSASLAMAGGPFGAVLGTLSFGLVALLPTEQLMSWGWRVPFLLSAVIVIFGLYIRRKLEESPPEFTKIVEESEQAVVPAGLVFTKYPPRQVLLGVLAGTCSLFVQGLLGSYMVPFLVNNHGMDRSQALLLLSLSYVFHTAAIPFFAWLSDIIGRQRMMLIGMGASLVLIWPMFALFRHGGTLPVALGFLLGNAVIQARCSAPSAPSSVKCSRSGRATPDCH